MDKEVTFTKYMNRFLFLAVFSLIFNVIPRYLQLNFLAGFFARELPFYFLFIFCIYFSIYSYKYGNIFKDVSSFKKYIYLYFIITLITAIHGLYNYQYYEMVLNGQISQIEKLPIVLNILRQHNILLNEKLALSFWMIARIIKANILYVLYTFIFSYILYCYMCDNYNKSMVVIKMAIYASLIIIGIYSLIEVMYLINNNIAKEILVNVNPIIHEIKIDGTWYPPLLWKGQLRSVFTEPSYFGMYVAFVIPFLWNDILLSNRWKLVSIVALMLSFLLFLTKA